MEDRIERDKRVRNHWKCIGLLALCLLVQLPAGQACAQWETASGPSVQIPLAFETCAAKGDTVFAGTYREGGVFRSTDGGKDWENVFQHYTIYSMAIVGQRVYVGLAGGIFESTDFGNSWEADTNGFPPNLLVLSIAGSGNRILAGTGDGLYISDDGGERWAESTSTLINQSSDINSLYVSDSAVYAGTDSGVFRSEDYGITWQSASIGLPNSPPDIYSLTSDRNVLFAGTSNGVYRSSDKGASWVEADSGLPGNYGNSRYNVVFSVAENYGVLYAGPEGAGLPYESTDGGRIWSPLFPNITSAYVFGFCFVKSTVFAATMDGLYRRSNESDIWQASLTQYGSKPTLNVVFNYGDQLLASGTAYYYNGSINATLYSNDSGRTWGEYYSPDNSPPFTSFLMYGGASYGITAEGVKVTTDGGLIWNGFNSGFAQYPQYSVNTLFGYHGEIFAGTGAKYGLSSLPSSTINGGIYVFGNGKPTWTLTALKDTAVYSFVSIGTHLVAGTSSGIFLSTDGGRSWVARNSGLPVGSRIYSLCQAGGNVYAATQNMVYVSNYLMDMWTKSTTTPLQGSYGLNPISLFSEDDNVLATTGEGIYLLAPNGNWEKRDSGLAGAELDIHSLAMMGDYIYAATDSGLVRRPVPGLLDLAAGATLPSQYYLSQNYPNPFNPSTTISYFLPSAGEVTLAVYDVLGRKVATLANGWESGGKHQLLFNGATLASGVYFYRLQSGGYSVTKKMLLMK